MAFRLKAVVGTGVNHQSDVAFACCVRGTEDVLAGGDGNAAIMFAEPDEHGDIQCKVIGQGA